MTADIGTTTRAGGTCLEKNSMVRKILRYPNRQLRQRSQEVKRFNKSLQRLVLDLKDTMQANRGIGIAAPQVGSFRRVIVALVKLSTTQPPVPYVLVNPEITRAEGIKCLDEACLSVPGKIGLVTRHKEIQVKYQDVEGNNKEAIFVDEEACIVQHEVDHLDGILFIDRVEGYEQSNDSKS
jgi:peptide deformylase